MSTITLRNTKGSALTFTEMDTNFSNLNTDKLEAITSESIGDLSDVDLTGLADTNVLVYNSGSGNFEVGSQTAGLSNIVEDTTPQLGGDLDAQTNNITNLGTLNSHTVPGGTGTLALTSDITFTDLVNDTTPQLGGDLDINGQSIISTGDQNITIDPAGNGQVILNGSNLNDASLINYKENINSLGSNDSPSIDVANGNVQSVTITSGLALPAFSNPETGQSVTLLVSGTGSATGTAAYRFAGGNKTLTTLSVVSIFYDGTNYFASIATDFQA